MKSIAIIDDHPAIRSAIRGLFHNTNAFNVLFDTDKGMNGLAFLKKQAADLIILDLELPDIDGFEVWQRVCAAHLPCKVLFLSAKNENIYALRALKCGAHGYISKSRDLEDIFQAASMILSGYTFFPQTAMQSLNSAGDPALDCAIGRLSNRELMIARLLAQGLSNLDISRQLAISNKTVSTYKTRIFQKLNVQSVMQLAQQVQIHAAD